MPATNTSKPQWQSARMGRGRSGLAKCNIRVKAPTLAQLCRGKAKPAWELSEAVATEPGRATPSDAEDKPNLERLRSGKGVPSFWAQNADAARPRWERLRGDIEKLVHAAPEIKTGNAVQQGLRKNTTKSKQANSTNKIADAMRKKLRANKKKPVQPLSRAKICSSKHASPQTGAVLPARAKPRRLIDKPGWQ